MELLQAHGVAPEGVWNRYKHQEIKEVVQSDSSAKCIYCESKVLHISFGDIEHMKPKSRFPASTFSWENLGLVCTKCNVAKGNRYDEQLPPVNPYEEEPADFLIPIGQFVWHQPGNDRGQVTEHIVQLNRPELIQRRLERLETIRSLVDAIARAPNPTLRGILTDQLCLELMNDREYLFVSRALAAALGFHWEDCIH